MGSSESNATNASASPVARECADALGEGVALAVVDCVALALGLVPVFIEGESDGAVAGEPACVIADRMDANAKTKIKRATTTKVSRNAFDRLSHQIPTKPRLVGGNDQHTACERACVL